MSKLIDLTFERSVPQYYKHYESGEYSCVVCGDALFSSATKYESGSGWPAFYDVMDSGKIMTRADASGGVLLRILFVID